MNGENSGIYLLTQREREVKQRARDKRKKRWKGHRPSVGRHRLENGAEESHLCVCVVILLGVLFQA